MLTIIEGVCDLDGKLLFKNKELMDKFKAPTPKELARKLLLPGEITNLYRYFEMLWVMVNCSDRRGKKLIGTDTGLR